MEFVMSSVDLEQSFASQKACLEARLVILSMSVENVEKLARLNLQGFKSIVAGNQTIAAGALSAIYPKELLALQAEQAKHSVQRAKSHWRTVYEIISGSLAEITGTVETQFKRNQYDWQVFIDNLAKNPPPGREAAVSI
ncbi:hypothetical protein BZM27_47885 [Paraburkholderia steynii]|uniref:Phasin domain-containing protein n=1 Tax=Paraburkholderia steynii TaxID=1245441 RepID=A0A4R0X0L5_9BURK|nr:hypothetical protein BZM27_47885 [Paraburkholderia steynii]